MARPVVAVGGFCCAGAVTHLSTRGVPARLLTAALDLVLPQECLGCGRPGAPVCPDCLRPLRGRAQRHAPTPTPAGFPPTWAVAPYDGVARAAVVAHKEEGRRDLAPALAGALTCSLQAALAEAARSAHAPVLVVAVPSRRASRRARGDDPTARLARLAVARSGAARLGSARPRLLPLLRHARTVADQAGLDAAARGANLAGAFVATELPRWAGVSPTVVVVDDVVTTGATLAEAARALRGAGAGPVVAAVVAATARRRVAWCR